MCKTSMISRCGPLLLLLITFTACTTVPQKPPTPKPIVSDHAPQPRGLDGTPGAAPQGGQPGGGAGAPGSGQGYGAASANGAEVQEEEVAADGSTRVVSSTTRAAATGAGQRNAGGSGGAPMLPGSVDDRRGSGGGTRTPVGAASSRPGSREMVGIHYREAPASQGSLDDKGGVAAHSGTPDGREGGRGMTTAQDPAKDASDNGRLGVRGGSDERGEISGAPPATGAQRPAPAAPVVMEDDILAQQLREAAEKEQDPVLRDKLWAEYRKYKAGL